MADGDAPAGGTAKDRPHAARERNDGYLPATDGTVQPPVPWGDVFRRAPVAFLLSTGLGVGLLPGPSGTWGSLATVLALEALPGRRGGGPALALGAAAFLAGLWAAGRTARLRGVADPPEIVVDEVAGQALALSGLYVAFPLLAGNGRLLGVAAAFGVFRLLDILKPGPIGRLERLPGGLGIMADDVAAGLLVGAAFLILGTPGFAG